VIAGNHDHVCEADPAGARARVEAAGARYLVDEEVTIDGRRFWGSPVTPAFRSLAFNRERGPAIRAHWEKIPRGLDVLVTHGPPRGIGDRIVLGMHVGCDDLLACALEAAPKLHVFGHIHEAFGEYRHAGAPATRFLNVASRRLLPRATRTPVLVYV
jgi:Icc-related predicted phosphoesterase